MIAVAISTAFSKNISDVNIYRKSKWDNYSNCREWNLDPECKFELDQWININTSHIINYNTIKNNTMQFYASKIAKYINITNLEEPVWLNSSDGLSRKCMNSGCIYIITFMLNQNVTIEISRKETISENIEIILSKESSISVFSNKDLTTCSSKVFKTNDYLVKSLTLHIISSSPESEFSIKITQIKDANEKVPKWVFIVWYSLNFIFPILLLLWILKSSTRPMNLSELAISNGIFSKWENKYKQTTWTICIEEFALDSEVSVIDECKHLFHKAWIIDWLAKSSSSTEYLCPFWRREISTKSN